MLLAHKLAREWRARQRRRGRFLPESALSGNTPQAACRILVSDHAPIYTSSMLEVLPLGVSLRIARPSELRRIADIDDDAGTLYDEFGIFVDLALHSPYVEAESRRWRASLAAARVWLAVDSRDHPIGFISCGFVDGEPFVEQLSVRRAHMQRGLGRALLNRAIAFASDRSLWLTTYGHLPWNRPYYERAGFRVVEDAEQGPELRALLELERRSLPAPEQRVAMRRSTRDA